MMSETKLGEKDDNINRTFYSSKNLVGLIFQTIRNFMFNPLEELVDVILVLEENGQRLVIDGSGKRIPFESLDPKLKDFAAVASASHKSDYVICVKTREKSIEEILNRPELLRFDAVARVYFTAKQFVEFVENKNLLK